MAILKKIDDFLAQGPHAEISSSVINFVSTTFIQHFNEISQIFNS